jgi:hypothetical protein
MKIYLESDVECTVDGVGLLEPGKPVEVNTDVFKAFHNVRPADANFPRSVRVIFDTSRPEAEEAEVVEQDKEEVN